MYHLLCQILLCENSSWFFYFLLIYKKKKKKEWKHKAASGLARNRAKIQTGKALIPALIQGLRKGFISQAISIVSVIVGIWASARFANLVADWVAQYITASEQVIKVVAFALILVVVFIALGLLGRLLENILNFAFLGWLNKLLGVIFSLLKAFLIIGLVILAFNSLNNAFGLVKPEVINDSVLYGPVKNLADTIFPYIKNMLALK